jgi:hypothetical protein
MTPGTTKNMLVTCAAAMVFWLYSACPAAQPEKELDPKIAAAWRKAGHDTNVVEAWHKVGVKIGWYGPDPFGFETFEKKRHDASWPAFWCKPIASDVIAKLPAPGAPFALHFGGSKILDSELKALARFKHLEALGLNNTGVGDRGLKELAAIRGLRSLSISDTQVSDAGLQEISGLPHLHTLYAAHTKVTDSGIKAIARIGSLQNLELSNTKITDGTVMDLIGLKQLKTLAVTRTLMTDAGVATLQKANPQLKITR